MNEELPELRFKKSSLLEKEKELQDQLNQIKEEIIKIEVTTCKLTSSSAQEDQSASDICRAHSQQPADTSTERKLRETTLPSQFKSLKIALMRHLGEQVTCEQIISAGDQELLKLPYIGAKKISLFNNLKEYLKSKAHSVMAHDEIERQPESWPPKEKLSDLSINFGKLSEAEQKLVKQLSREIHIPLSHINASHIIYNCSSKLKRKTTAGQTYEDILVGLKEKMYPELNRYIDRTDDEIKSSLTESGLLSYSGYINFNATELSDIINYDLTVFLENTDKREGYILKSRFGIDDEPIRTLEEVGQSIPQTVTRERVRQLQKIVSTNLLSSLSITPSNILENIKENLKHNIDSIYPSLSRRFSTKKGFIKFVELICQANKGEIGSLINPPINRDFISSFAEYVPAPFTRAQVTSQITEHFGYGDQQADNALDRLLSENNLDKRSDGFYPVKLSKPEAFAQAALHFPEGASFKTIHEFSNKQGFCDSHFPLDRQDHGVTGAVDNGVVYLSAHGTYRHVNYLDINEQNIESVLSRTREKLLSLEKSGIKTANLKIDIYESCRFNQDYFTIRHIIREYGIEKNIYFKGRSGADTASLNESFNIKGQKEAIIQLFTLQPGARTVNDIASLIRSSSIGHAQFYISELIEDGMLVRIGANHYDKPESFFHDAPIALVMERSEAVLASAKKPVEVGIIMEDCNRRFHRSNSKVWYLSLIKHYSKKQNKDWHFFHNTLSEKPIDNLTVQRCVLEALEAKLSRQKTREYVLERILVTNTALEAAINNMSKIVTEESDLVSAYLTLSLSKPSVRLRGWKDAIY